MNAIQGERMRGYFLAAARELIRGEGLEVVSARNVAQRAGYSYATLYNYFKDIRDLIFSCVQDFMAECREFVHKDISENQSAKEGIAAVSCSYAKFFVQYPGIFDLFYQTRASQISTPKSDFKAIDTFFDSLVAKQWQIIRAERSCGEEAAQKAQRYHKFALHGLLTFFLNKRIDGDFRLLMHSINEITDTAIEMV